MNQNGSIRSNHFIDTAIPQKYSLSTCIQFYLEFYTNHRATLPLIFKQVILIIYN